MSIATEITRLQGAKADLKTSIEAKGVTVPSATLISGYSALVDQIQAGGIPDSDGLVDLVIANGDQAGGSFTLEYNPVYLMKYSSSNPESSITGLTVDSDFVQYATPIVWSCDNANITISGNTVTVPGGFNSNVTFTATWVDYNGDSHTTSKTIHVVGDSYSVITLPPNDSFSWPKNTYFVCDGNQAVNYILTFNPTYGSSGPHIEPYNNSTIVGLSDVNTQVTLPNWQSMRFLSSDGSSPAVFTTLNDAKFAWDNRET